MLLLRVRLGAEPPVHALAGRSFLQHPGGTATDIYSLNLHQPCDLAAKNPRARGYLRLFLETSRGAAGGRSCMAILRGAGAIPRVPRPDRGRIVEAARRGCGRSAARRCRYRAQRARGLSREQPADNRDREPLSGAASGVRPSDRRFLRRPLNRDWESRPREPWRSGPQAGREAQLVLMAEATFAHRAEREEDAAIPAAMIEEPHAGLFIVERVGALAAGRP